MTLQDIALRNLKRRKSKAAFILLGLAIGVSSVVAFLTLVDALTMDINHKLEQYGANILIVPKTENLSLTYGGLSLGGVMFEMEEIQQKELEKIRTIRNAANVAAVGPMVLGGVEAGGRKVMLAGMDFSVYQALRPWWIVKGAIPEKGEVMAGSEAARVLNLSAGSRLKIRGQDLSVSGVLESTGSQDDQIFFTPLETAQQLLGERRAHLHGGGGRLVRRLSDRRDGTADLRTCPGPMSWLSSRWSRGEWRRWTIFARDLTPYRLLSPSWVGWLCWSP